MTRVTAPTVFRRLALALTAGTFALSPSIAAAQAAAPAPPAPAALPIAGWQNGFFLQSPNGDTRIQIGLLGQFDGRFSIDDPTPVVNTFTLRKARAIFAGRLSRYVEFRVMPDFGNGGTTLQDAYFDLRFSPALRIRTGKDKTPVGYELLQGDPGLLFPERSLASGLVPNRDIGVAAQGALAGGKLVYSAGIFNGVADGASTNTDVDTNNGKDLAGRLVLQPFLSSQAAPAASGFGMHLGGTHGRQSGALPAFKTSGGGQTYFRYAAAGDGLPAATASGERSRVTPGVFYYHQAFGAFAEYVRSTQAVTRGGAVEDITNTGWDVTAAFTLTGEATTTRVVTPRRPFDPANGAWGALQIVARVADVTIDDAAFDGGFASAGSSRRARAAAIGVNWYPTAYVKYYATFERTVFDGNAHGARAPEDVVLFRAQFSF
jgi:phosphate-selective porin OprO/OprP